MNIPDFSTAYLSEQRKEGDTLADSFIAHVFADTEQKTGLQNWLHGLAANRQLTVLPAAYMNEPIIVTAGQLPGWADFKLMQAGAAFFARHAQVIMNLLGLHSLPYCYAAANGAMVLHLSNRIKSDTGKRLAETGEFIWEVMAPNAFEPEGKGFISCLKIRLMHAAVRYYTLKSGKWDEAWGFPVNQEDMAGTNLSFSLLIIRGLRKFGYTISYADQQAYLHLWNVIGHLLGSNSDLLPTDGRQANQLEEAIRLHQFRPSEHGRELTAALIRYFASVTANPLFSANETVQIMRYLLGNELADTLNLDMSPISSIQLRLLTTLSLVDELKLPKNPRTAYLEEYRKFKKTQAV